MFSSVPFSQIPGFSKLFCEFIAENCLFTERFLYDNSTSFADRSAKFTKRRELSDAIADAMSGLAISDAQRRSLDALGSTNGLAVVTGQQVGFLGGANYTALKLYSAVEQAQQYTNKYPDFNFAPVFWIEDDDHDATEAAETTILTASGELMRISCATADDMPGVSVSARVFGDNIVTVLEKIREVLPKSQYADELMEWLGDAYAPGTGWSAAFVRLMHRLFGETGILFITASAVRRRGLAAGIILKEIENPKVTAQKIDYASARLAELGLHAQIAGSDVNLFYIENSGKRSKIRIEEGEYTVGIYRRTADELRREAEEYPEHFSPNVALRPLVQDAVMPTVCYVAGPGEIAYFAQLREVYDFFGVTMPYVAPRHSATLITPTIARFLQKSGIVPEFFLHPWSEIDKGLAAQSRSEEFDAAIAHTKNGLLEAFNTLAAAAESADATLLGATKAALSQTLKSVEHIEKKAVAALKRKNEMSYAKYRAAANLIFPSEILQERTIAVAAWCAIIGRESFNSTLSTIVAQPPKAHFFASLFQ